MQEFIELLEEMPQPQISSPANTIAHIFRHDYKENFISDWLAFLLDPELTDSTQPLAALFELAQGVEPDDISDISIFRERTFDDKRRIDFYIETSRYIIGIENKIWSDLQPNQLSDYERQLSSIATSGEKELILILLCPKSNKLCTAPDLKLGSFKMITYEDVVEEFKKIRFNLFTNLRATVLMEDFILHMEEYIMQNSNKTMSNLEMWRFEAAYKEKLQDLLARFEASKKQFGAYIAERLSAIAADREDSEAWAPPSIHANTKESYFQLYKTNWADAQVHFEVVNGDKFPPTELQVVLHTRERGRKGKTDELYNLQSSVENYLRGKYGRDVFPVSYESDASFDQSMNKIFDILKELVARYTEEVDAGIKTN